MVANFGSSPLTLAYSLVAGEFILAPAIPSVTPRSAGLILPVAVASAEACGSYGGGDPSSRHLGAYLVTTLYHTSAVSSATFLTSNQPNLLTAQLAKATLGVRLTWTKWAFSSFPMAIVTNSLLPLFIYLIYPPQAKSCSEAQAAAKIALQQMGSLTRQEWIMAGTMLLTVSLWVAGGFFKINIVAAAMCGLAVLFYTRVITWRTCLDCAQAWTMYIWFGAVLGLATQLEKEGIFDEITKNSEYWVGRLPWGAAFAVLLLIYYYLHYFFASNTAHIAALFPNFALLMAGAGAPKMLVALAVGQASNLMGTITTYGMTHGPMYYETGYVPKQRFYSTGLLVSFFFFVVWGGICVWWWKVIHLW